MSLKTRPLSDSEIEDLVDLLGVKPRKPSRFSRFLSRIPKVVITIGKFNLPFVFLFALVILELAGICRLIIESIW